MHIEKFLERILLAAGLLFMSAAAWAQGDVEPNNPCESAQDVTGFPLPVAINGELFPTGDIDFYKFAGVPGATIVANHRGGSFGFGTLGDPLLGVFDSSCALMFYNDDFGSLDSQVTFQVPGDGFFILAATAFPDLEFVGLGEGTYLLTVSTAAFAESVSGRLVSAQDGTPVSGDPPTAAFVELYRCDFGSCEVFAGSQPADSAGEFRIDMDAFGGPLLSGTYQLRAIAFGYETFFSAEFELAEGEALDLGDVAIQPLPLIGTLTGRLVDAFDGTPLNGFGPPFSIAQLERCETFGCFPVAGTQPDEQGRFRFEGIVYNLEPGDYRVAAFAEGYFSTVTEAFFVGVSEDYDFGDVPLRPLPIQFGATYPCEVPMGGGQCDFGIEIRNRGQRAFKGEGWGTIDYFRNGPPFLPSRFQVGQVGAMIPMPVQINLRPGETMTLRFRLDIPGDLPEFSSICGSVAIGRAPNPQFRNLGDRFVFCGQTQSGQFSVLSEKEGRKLLRDQKNRGQ